MLSNNDKLVTFAYSVQDDCRYSKSFYGDFDASDVVETIDISLHVENTDSKNVCIKLPVKLKKHIISFKCLCMSCGYFRDNCFRSGRGAELAIQAYVELLSENIDKLDKLYNIKYFKTIEKSFSIGIAGDRWVKKIVKDLITKPITKNELENLEKYNAKFSSFHILDEFNKEYKKFCEIKDINDKVVFIRSSSLKEIYDCDFMAYMQTKDFWYVMKIGSEDFAVSYNGFNFYRPIEETNKICSLCKRECYRDFKFAHGKVIPKYVFCFSDEAEEGISFRYDGLFNFYKAIVRRFTSIEFDDYKHSSFDKEVQKAKQFIADELYKESGEYRVVSLATILNFNALDFANYKKSFASLDIFKEGIRGKLIQEIKKEIKEQLIQEIREEIKKDLLEEVKAKERDNGKSDNSMDVVSIEKKILVVFFLVDTSLNMKGEKIQTVNEAVCEIIPIISDIANNNVYSEIKIAVLSFNDVANWETPSPVALKNYKCKDFSASGETLMSEAFFELDSKLDENAFLSSSANNYAPCIILLSVGKPIDNYKRGLATLKQNKWYNSAIKLAFAIGKDANKDILAEFTGNVDLVLDVDNKIMLRKLIKFISVYPSKVVMKTKMPVEEKQEQSHKEKKKEKIDIADSDDGAW